MTLVLPGVDHPWTPTSPCGPGCLPPPTPTPPLRRAVRTLRAAARLGGIGVVLATGALLVLVAPRLEPRRAGHVQRRWAMMLLAAVGVRVELHGPPPGPGSLVVANHVSWLDVLAVATVVPVRLLAKREVRSWPLIGLMAARVGTVFLDRQRLHALPAAVSAVAATLRTGGRVGVFAEGTTRCGRTRGRFRPAAFQAAIDAAAPVVPLALSYTDTAGTPCTSVAFVGDDTLWSSLTRVAGAPRVVVRLEVLDVLRPGTEPFPASVCSGIHRGRAAGRRDLAARCAAAVEEALVGRAAPGPAPDVTVPEPVQEFSRAA